MFWRKKREAMPFQSAVAAPLRPTPKLLTEAESEAVLEEYTRVASVVGFAPGALTEARFKTYLKQNGIPLYDGEEVRAFLTSVFPEERDPIYGWSRAAGWNWVALRQVDRDRKLHFSGMAHRLNGAIDENRVYQKAVPLAVLQTVERITKEVPEVHFFVSDAAGQPEGDPFLMVTTAGMSSFIIECWDEPGFTGRAK